MQQNEGKMFCRLLQSVFLCVCVANGKWMPQNVAIFSIFPLCCHYGRISHAHSAHQMHRYVATSQYQLSPIGKRFSFSFSFPLILFIRFISHTEFVFFWYHFSVTPSPRPSFFINNHNSYLLMCSICF